MDGSAETRPQTITLSMSVVFPEKDGDPLVARRVVVNGREVTLPVAVILGRGESPLVVYGGYDEAADFVSHAQALLQLSTKLAGDVLLAAAQAATPQLEAASRRRRGKKTPPPASS